MHGDENGGAETMDEVDEDEGEETKKLRNRKKEQNPKQECQLAYVHSLNPIDHFTRSRKLICIAKRVCTYCELLTFDLVQQIEVPHSQDQHKHNIQTN
mmetsp:Transcript_50164/g.64299  ORF Transcript_50164/g.64299 Transcript_50164/m.64299 type:complete len:98 (+) Transcript_50164:1352-1645(+)